MILQVLFKFSNIYLWLRRFPILSLCIGNRTMKKTWTLKSAWQKENAIWHKYENKKNSIKGLNISICPFLLKHTFFSSRRWISSFSLFFLTKCRSLENCSEWHTAMDLVHFHLLQRCSLFSRKLLVSIKGKQIERLYLLLWAYWLHECDNIFFFYCNHFKILLLLLFFRSFLLAIVEMFIFRSVDFS